MRWPGSPTVPTTNRSGGSNSWITGTAPAYAAPRRRAAGPAPATDGRIGRGEPAPAALLGWRREPGQVAVVGVGGQHEGPGRGVAHDRDRRRVDVQPLEQVEVHAQRVGQQRLDQVAVADRGPHGAGAVLLLDRRVPAAYGVHDARLHRTQRLAARERGRRRLGLHDLPERLLGELLQRAALPLAVVALGQALVGDHPELAARLPLCAQHGLRGLPAALQRAGDHCGQRAPRPAGRRCARPGPARSRRAGPRACGRRARRRRWRRSARAGRGSPLPRGQASRVPRLA